MATKRLPRAFRWTRAHLARFPNDGNRYDVLDGELLAVEILSPGSERHDRHKKRDA